MRNLREGSALILLMVIRVIAQIHASLGLCGVTCDINVVTYRYWPTRPRVELRGKHNQTRSPIREGSISYHPKSGDSLNVEKNKKARPEATEKPTASDAKILPFHISASFILFEENPLVHNVSDAADHQWIKHIMVL